MRPTIVIFDSIHQDGVKKLAEFSDIKFAFENPKLSQKELLSTAHAIVIKSSITIGKNIVENSPLLQLVARAGTGLDNIDQQLLIDRGIKLISCPHQNSVSAAEFTVMQILNLYRKTFEIARNIKQNDFRRHLVEGREIKNTTIGIVGTGSVGYKVAKILRAFGSKVIFYDKNENNLQKLLSYGCERAKNLDELLKKCDLLSLHARLDKHSKGIIGAREFSLMKKNIKIINTARAELINQEELLKALESGIISSAALDVIYPEMPFESEPDKHFYSNKLLDIDRVYITPHVAASTVDAQKRISMYLAMKIQEHFTNLS